MQSLASNKTTLIVANVRHKKLHIILKFVQTSLCAQLCFVSFIAHGCVFDYNRGDAIRQWHDICDALSNILTIKMHRVHNGSSKLG